MALSPNLRTDSSLPGRISPGLVSTTVQILIVIGLCAGCRNPAPPEANEGSGATAEGASSASEAPAALPAHEVSIDTALAAVSADDLSGALAQLRTLDNAEERPAGFDAAAQQLAQAALDAYQSSVAGAALVLVDLNETPTLSALRLRFRETQAEDAALRSQIDQQLRQLLHQLQPESLVRAQICETAEATYWYRFARSTNPGARVDALQRAQNICHSEHMPDRAANALRDLAQRAEAADSQGEAVTYWEALLGLELLDQTERDEVQARIRDTMWPRFHASMRERFLSHQAETWVEEGLYRAEEDRVVVRFDIVRPRYCDDWCVGFDQAAVQEAYRIMSRLARRATERPPNFETQFDTLNVTAVEPTEIGYLFESSLSLEALIQAGF